MKIAVIGDIPELNNEKITFETIALEEFSKKVWELQLDLMLLW